MYAFRDINENITLVPLGSEAMQLNGKYLETEIEGYKTLYVKGREALSPEIDVTDIKSRDGSIFLNKKYPARTITIGYQIVSRDSASFREAFNKLGALLDVEDAKLIFNDEPDKFFVGTPSYISEIAEGRNSITSEFEIICFDPLKYSVVEYEANTSVDGGNTILVDYNGTYKAYPILEADFYEEIEVSEGSANTLTGNGDCGYVAFFNENEKIIQLGDPKEEDGSQVYPSSQTLLNQTFEEVDSWNTSVQSLWPQNAGITIPATTPQMGTLGMKVASYTQASIAETTYGTILNSARSDVGSPYIYYSVSLKAFDRTSNAVTVEAIITTSLASSGSYFGTGLGLKGSLYIGGAWHDVVLKKTSEYWRGQTAHTVSVRFTVTGLNNDTTVLSGIQFAVSRIDSNGSSGKLNARNCNSMSISKYSVSVPDSYILGATNYGTATGWHSTTFSRLLPADAASVVGASDFSLTVKGKLKSEGSSEMGAFFINLTDANNKTVAGIRVVKNKAGKLASLNYYVGEGIIQTSDINISTNILDIVSINKTGETFTFEVSDIKEVFVNTSMTDTKVVRITVGFEQYSSVNGLSQNGLNWIKFVKNNCESWINIPNKFSANDILEANCKNGEILLNGKKSPQLGALGNDWEEFCLKPGINQIGVSYSSWVSSQYAPKCKVRYREAFL